MLPPVRGRRGRQDRLGTSKDHKGVLAQLGENVLFLRPDHLRQGKMQGRFQKGVFLGRVDRTNEVMVGVGNQLVRTTKLLRLPEKEQWSAEALEGLRGVVPWTAERTADEGALEVVLPGPLASANAGPAG